MLVAYDGSLESPRPPPSIYEAKGSLETPTYGKHVRIKTCTEEHATGTTRSASIAKMAKKGIIAKPEKQAI